MRQLEKKFGKPHPELLEFKEPPEALGWLISAYFRLHRRRQHSDMGTMLPLTLSEMAVFYSHAIRLDRSLEPLFFRCMEATDNAVLYDQHKRVSAQREKEKHATENAPRTGPKTRSKPRR